MNGNKRLTSCIADIHGKRVFIKHQHRRGEEIDLMCGDLTRYRDDAEEEIKDILNSIRNLFFLKWVMMMNRMEK